MKTFHDNRRIKVDGELTYLLSHWVTADGIVICVSGPTVHILREHDVTEEDGSPLSLLPGDSVVEKRGKADCRAPSEVRPVDLSWEW
jgi:hypothetical protein